MTRMIVGVMSTALLVVLCLFALNQRTVLGAAAVSRPAWNKADAAAYLDQRGQWWLGWGGSARGQGTACISCHTGLPIALARPAVGRSLAEAASGAVEQNLISNITYRVNHWNDIVASTNWQACVAYYGDQKPAALGTESVMNALVLVNHDDRRLRGQLSPTTLTALSYLWQEQQSDGSWRWLDFGLRPWESDGTYYGAALAAVAVGMSGKGYYDSPSVRSNVALLRKYLLTNYASRPLHDRVVCLWASTYLPGVVSSDDAKSLVQSLLSIQDDDGGWSLSKLGAAPSNPQGWPSGNIYPAGSESDGFATGLVVLTLKRLDFSSGQPQLAKGVAWLSTSEANGSWPANYINGPRDPQSDEGGFMRDAATGFAVLGLSEPYHR